MASLVLVRQQRLPNKGFITMSRIHKAAKSTDHKVAVMVDGVMCFIEADKVRELAKDGFVKLLSTSGIFEITK